MTCNGKYSISEENTMMLPNKSNFWLTIPYAGPCLSVSGESWDPYMRKDIDRLGIVQNRAVRFICKLKIICSINAAKKSLI